MSGPPTVLVVSHSRTGSTQALVEEALAAAGSVDGVTLRVVDALEAVPADVLAADGYLLATPENFGSMSGAMKYFFESIFYACEHHTRGRPYGLIVKGGEDGTGARESVERIVAGLGWRLVQEPLVVTGDTTEADRLSAAEIGGSLAALVTLDR